jgi:threonine/homoserine/homoserine lactone efflux protein
MLAFVLGLGLGLSLAAPPGPMNALIAREASQRGWLSGMRLGMGAPVADVLWLVVLLFGLGKILQGPVVLQGAAGAGSLLMLYFAFDTWTADARAPTNRPPTFLAGFVAALLNPYQGAWWLSGGFVFLNSQGVIGVLGLILGIFGWVVAFSWLVANGAQKWHWFTPAIRFVSTFVLLAFAMLLAGIGLGIMQL